MLLKTGTSNSWFGINRYLARYLGRGTQSKGGVTVRGHYFKNSFIQTTRSGYRSIWHRSASGGIKQTEFDIDDTISLESIWDDQVGEFESDLQVELAKELARSKVAI
jgi:hypothetical protein